MRKVKIVSGEYYHIYNRGNNKQPVFRDEKDWIRFLFLITHCQSHLTFYNLGRQVACFVRHSVFNISREVVEEIIKNRSIELINFTLMPNHFHLIIHGLKENGISQYMQRVLNAYTKYFNTKYKISGHLFQGPFQIVHIKNDDQLLYLSAYIHRNPREIKEWADREHLFPYSSYQDCINKNRWGNLLETGIVTKQFSSSEKYKLFVETSGAKDLSKILDEKQLLD
ncbi:MAG: transposase [Candidatus Nealsonbacteria bacterium]|nr:transposase [Candidatus Nealsonbacteria bacterium]